MFLAGLIPAVALSAQPSPAPFYSSGSDVDARLEVQPSVHGPAGVLIGEEATFTIEIPVPHLAVLGEVSTTCSCLRVTESGVSSDTLRVDLVGSPGAYDSAIQAIVSVGWEADSVNLDAEARIDCRVIPPFAGWPDSVHAIDLADGRKIVQFHESYRGLVQNPAFWIAGSETQVDALFDQDAMTLSVSDVDQPIELVVEVGRSLSRWAGEVRMKGEIHDD